MKRIVYFLLLGLLALPAVHSCEEWTEVKPVETKILQPWERDASLWEAYLSSLKQFKSRTHFLSYVRFGSGMAEAGSERDYLLCLPDSLDYVSLTNGDHFSSSDAEDLSLLHAKGIKVLYQVNFAGRLDEFPDASALGAYLDKVIAATASLGLDGYSFTGAYKMGDPGSAEAAALLVKKLSEAKSEGQMLAFEGNPLFIPEDDREKVDLFILNTEETDCVSALLRQVQEAVDFVGIPPAKILLAARADASLFDEERREHPAVDEMAGRVFSFGPLGGLAVYNVDTDYYHAEGNYTGTRAAIQKLNPSK